MTPAPALSMKRLDDMSIPELLSDRRIYDAAIQAAIDKRQRPHPMLYDALLAYDAVIARKLRQIEGDAIPPDGRLPDTNNLEAA